MLNRRHVFAVPDARWFDVKMAFRTRQAGAYDEFLAAFGADAEHSPPR